MRIDGLLSLLQLRSCASAVDLYILSSMMTLDITKFVQGRCPSSIWKSTNRYAFSAVKEEEEILLLCNILSQMMDETWLCHSKPDVEAWSRNTSSPRTKKFRNMPSTSKVMLMQLWDIKTPMLELCQDCGQMISSIG
jgi:hypothetical protein